MSPAAQSRLGNFVELKHLLHEQRLIKSPKEIGLMRRAAEITSTAHLRAMQACAPGMTEGQLEAELTYEFMRSGARTPAYPCIVGSGNNACVLHYVSNSASMKKSDLVLIDAGCEYEHYAADLTRTFPVGGSSAPRRKPSMRWCLQPTWQRLRSAAPAAISMRRTRRRCARWLKAC